MKKIDELIEKVAIELATEILERSHRENAWAASKTFTDKDGEEYMFARLVYGHIEVEDNLEGREHPNFCKAVEATADDYYHEYLSEARDAREDIERLHKMIRYRHSEGIYHNI